MAIIVEDGTGLANAETYVSVVDADAYHAAFGNTAWAAASTPAKEVALRNAAQYIDTEGGYTFKGYKLVETQALKWPRSGVYVEGIAQTWPVKGVCNACNMLALRALAGPLTTDVDDRAVTEETVGPITTKYAGPTRGGQTKYTAVENTLRELLEGGGGSGVLKVRRV